MPAKYADRTEVPTVRSLAEIEAVLNKYGAQEMRTFKSELKGRFGVSFQMEGRTVEFVVPFPDRSDFEKTPTGRLRTPSAIDEEYSQEIRRRYRALVIAIKAKLEAVSSGIGTFDQEFLANIVVDGVTVGDSVIAKLPPRVRETSLVVQEGKRR